ncbi:MAG TPA: hypothetical protein VFX18_00155 [Candidatus Nitrosocosmicus sp.]|nr:hypothetical protein [Candidatus Nitrosocosmicus sp.]
MAISKSVKANMMVPIVTPINDNNEGMMIVCLIIPKRNTCAVRENTIG